MLSKKKKNIYIKVVLKKKETKILIIKYNIYFYFLCYNK